MTGYKFNTIAEVNSAIQQVNTANNFTPINGNVTQTLVCASQGTYQGDDFYYILEDNYTNILGVSEEILIDEVI
jgi:type II secretory pathway pseudopilin PulG